MDLSKSPQQIIVDKINEENGTKLTVHQLLFGIPKQIDGDHNTVVKVTAKPFTGIVGTVELRYNRIDLGSIINPGTVNIVLRQSDVNIPVSNEYIKLSDIVGLINDQFGINITHLDYIDMGIVKPDVSKKETVAFNRIYAAEESLIYRGYGDISITYGVGFYDVALNQVILHPYLDGFVLGNLIG